MQAEMNVLHIFFFTVTIFSSTRNNLGFIDFFQYHLERE